MICAGGFFAYSQTIIYLFYHSLEFGVFSAKIIALKIFLRTHSMQQKSCNFKKFKFFKRMHAQLEHALRKLFALTEHELNKFNCMLSLR
jgi:hypothetical protein